MSKQSLLTSVHDMHAFTVKIIMKINAYCVYMNYFSIYDLKFKKTKIPLKVVLRYM